MQADDWGQDGVDTDVPNAARMYDYYLGGLHNFPADREMAQRVIGAYPILPAVIRQNRAFLRRAVRYMVGAGIRQFLDLGSGLPSVGNVHEIAQAEAPDVKVVYVDSDATAVLHSRLMLVGNPNATVLQMDLRKVDQVLSHRDLRWQLDLDQPVGLITAMVLHFVGGDDDPASLMAAYSDGLAAGSHMAISHASPDIDPVERERVMQLYSRSGSPLYWRDRAGIEALFADFAMVEPGLVLPNQWHPELADGPLPEVAGVTGYCGVARKP